MQHLSVQNLYSEETMNYTQCDYSIFPICGILLCYRLCLLRYLSFHKLVDVDRHQNETIVQWPKFVFRKKKSPLALKCKCSQISTRNQQTIGIRNIYTFLLHWYKTRAVQSTREQRYCYRSALRYNVKSYYVYLLTDLKRFSQIAESVRTQWGVNQARFTTHGVKMINAVAKRQTSSLFCN